MPNPQFTDGVTVLIKHKWKIVLAVLILLTVVTFLSIIFPLLDGIIMGVVLAYVARPMKHFIDRYTPRLSPYIATTAIVLPIFLIIGFGVIEIFNLILWTFKNQGYVVSSLLNLMEKMNLPDFARDKIKDIILNFTSYLLPIVERLPVVTIVKTFSMFIINALLAVLLCFFLLIDGGRLVDRVIDIIPLEVEDFFRRFMDHLDGILSAIFVGNTYSAIAVGLLSLIVFWIFGFANIVALSALMLLAALVPMLAGWMVIVPLTIYRYFETGSESAIIFFHCVFLSRNNPA